MSSVSHGQSPQLRYPIDDTAARLGGDRDTGVRE